MWLLFSWSQIVNVMKSDRYASPCTDISTLFQCAKVWSLKGWVCLNAGQLCCLRYGMSNFWSRFPPRSCSIQNCYCSSFVEWFLYLPGISIVFRNSGFRKHSMFWCCSVLYMCDRKCLKCEIKLQMKRACTKYRWEILCMRIAIFLCHSSLYLAVKWFLKHSGMLFNELLNEAAYLFHVSSLSHTS